MPGVLTGLIPACHTPFNRAGHLDLSVVPRQAELFRESGLSAVFVGGTTGEWSSLTREERMALCDRWTEAAGTDLKVAVHVGHNCQAEAVALASHARESGAAAVAAVSPSYFRPVTVSDLIDFLVPIAAAADPLPFYYYQIPSMTGVRLPASLLLFEGRGRIPNLRGLKFSHDDLVDLQHCVRADDGGCDVLFGFDECLLAGLVLGVRGAVGCGYNFAAGHFQALMRAFTRGDLDEARARQVEAAALVQLLGKYGFLAASKAVMGLIGVECGPVRPPLRNLTGEEREWLAVELRSFELFARPLGRAE
jgi:N-acetylneuraminate lyase